MISFATQNPTIGFDMNIKEVEIDSNQIKIRTYTVGDITMAMLTNTIHCVVIFPYLGFLFFFHYVHSQTSIP